MSYRDDPELMERMYEAFRTTPIHALLGIEFVIDPLDPSGLLDADPSAEVVVKMPVRPEAYGSSGNLHGGPGASHEPASPEL